MAVPWVKLSMLWKSDLRVFPLVPIHEENIAVNDAVQAIMEEVSEVVKVPDANVLQELIVVNIDCWPRALVHDSKSERKFTSEND